MLAQRQRQPGLSGQAKADVAVIGAGYTGIAVARRYAALRPAADVVVLDASEVGEGNPGRNSGFLLEIALANDASATARERMRRCNRLIGATMAELRQLVREHRIDCRLQRSGVYRAAAGRVGLRALRDYKAFLDAQGLPAETLDRDELHRRLGTRYYVAGLYSPHCYLAQPAALARGLAASLPSSVTLLENSPVLRLERQRDRWRLHTPDGVLDVSTVFVANNAFAKELGIGRARLAAMYTYAGLTAPLDGGAIPGPAWGLLPAHRLGSTLRRTTDGRLLIRSLYGYEREGDNGLIAVKLAKALRRRYPKLENAPFEHVWGGATGFTLNGSPLWGEAGSGLYVSAGCNGGGVVKGTLFGRLLADLACGRPVPDFASLFGRASWMPPEPLRRLGFGLLSGIERLKGRAEV